MCSINTVQCRPLKCCWWQPLGEKEPIGNKIEWYLSVTILGYGKTIRYGIIFLYLQPHKQRCHSSGCRLAQMHSTVLVPFGACLFDEIWECKLGQIGTLCQIPNYVRTFKIKRKENILCYLVLGVLKTLRFFSMGQ